MSFSPPLSNDVGVFTRPDSPVYWLWLETTRQKERTDIRIGETAAQRSDSKALALDRYHQRMNELAARLYKLPSAMDAIRFKKYAESYHTTIAMHAGAERELELLKPLVRFLGDDLLSTIDQDRVKGYMVWRKAQVSARTVNREVGLLKSMLRDACPKYLTVSPLVGMKYLRTVKPRRRLMTEAEERRLLAKADPVETALLVLGIDGLIRLSDLLELKASDRHGAWLHIRDPKGGESYEVALSARCRKALDALGKVEYYFDRYRQAEKQRDRRSTVRKALKRLCKSARVPYGRAKGGITFHWATRKTGATRLIVGRGAPVPAVQRQGNWKTADVLLSIYAEADRKAQQQAVALPTRSRGRRKSA